jgi:hypothetical protein
MCLGRENVDWIQQEPVAVYCERDNDPLGSIKDGEFLDQMGRRILFNLAEYQGLI